MKHVMKLAALAAALVSAVAIAAVVAGAFAQSRNVNAESVVSSKSATLVVSIGATSTVTTEAQYTQFYGMADCYSIYVAAVSPATATVKLQHSADSANWVDGASFTAQSSAGTVFTRTTLYGAYTRAVILPSNTNPMTMTVRCVFKNAE